LIRRRWISAEDGVAAGVPVLVGVVDGDPPGGCSGAGVDGEGVVGVGFGDRDAVEFVAGEVYGVVASGDLYGGRWWRSSMQ
jgi:hypothetical protein